MRLLKREEVRNLIIDSEITKEDRHIDEMTHVLIDKDQLKKIINEYVTTPPYDERKEKYNHIRSLTELQELKASTKEFNFMQKFIKQNDFQGYLDSRPNLNVVLKEIKYQLK